MSFEMDFGFIFCVCSCWIILKLQKAEITMCLKKKTLMFLCYGLEWCERVFCNEFYFSI